MDLKETLERAIGKTVKIKPIHIPKGGLVVFTVGDSNHEPTAEVLQRIVDQIIDSKTISALFKKKNAIAIATPYWVKVELLKGDKNG